jgi:hypothetical protein
VATAAPARIRQDGGEGGGQTERGIGFGHLRPAAVAGQAPTLEIDRQRQWGWRDKGKRDCGRLVHAGRLLAVVAHHSYRYQIGAPLSLMNNPG